MRFLKKYWWVILFVAFIVIWACILLLVVRNNSGIFWGNNLTTREGKTITQSNNIEYGVNHVVTSWDPDKGVLTAVWGKRIKTYTINLARTRVIVRSGDKEELILSRTEDWRNIFCVGNEVRFGFVNENNGIKLVEVRNLSERLCE